jgi:glycosyltransferase involved in cell wall biosynthesis
MYSLVSILIPCYNAEKWLVQSLLSATGQSWPKVEVILVDDGSKDRSLEVARSFQAGNVKVIHQENQGASVARNRAYAEAQGEYIQYLDADDLLAHDKIEAQVRFLESNPPDMLAVSATMHFLDGEDPSAGKLHDGWPRVDTDDPVNWLIDLLGPERGSMVQPGAWLTPRLIADKIGPWNETLSLNDDGEYFARAVLASKGIRYTPIACNYYRQFRIGANLSGQNSAAHLRSGIRALTLVEQHLLARTTDPRAKKALARVYTEFAFAAYPSARAVSNAALRRANELGGTGRPRFPTRKGELFANVFGWRAARCANHLYHRARSFLRY